MLVSFQNHSTVKQNTLNGLKRHMTHYKLYWQNVQHSQRHTKT